MSSIETIGQERRLRLSGYCLIIPYDKETYILFHTLKGGIALIDEEAKNFWNPTVNQALLLVKSKNRK